MTAEVTDLDDCLPQDTAVLEILKAGTKTPTGWKITLAGPSHPQTIANAEAAAKRNLQRQKEIEVALVNGRKYTGEDRSIEDARRENIEGVVSRIVTWTPVKIGGEVFEFSRPVAIDLLSRPKMGWVYLQIVEYLTADAAFTERSATG